MFFFLFFTSPVILPGFFFTYLTGLLETYSTDEFIKYTLRIVETALELGKLYWTPKRRRRKKRMAAEEEEGETEEKAAENRGKKDVDADDDDDDDGEQTKKKKKSSDSDHVVST